MRVGDFKERVRIDTTILTSDGQGGSTNSWGIGTEIWARVDNANESGLDRDGRIIEEEGIIVTVRKKAISQSTVSNARVVWGSDNYRVATIREVKNEERFVRLVCTKENR